MWRATYLRCAGPGAHAHTAGSRGRPGTAGLCSELGLEGTGLLHPAPSGGTGAWGGHRPLEERRAVKGSQDPPGPSQCSCLPALSMACAHHHARRAGISWSPSVAGEGWLGRAQHLHSPALCTPDTWGKPNLARPPLGPSPGAPPHPHSAGTRRCMGVSTDSEGERTPLSPPLQLGSPSAPHP